MYYKKIALSILFLCRNIYILHIVYITYRNNKDIVLLRSALMSPLALLKQMVIVVCSTISSTKKYEKWIFVPVHLHCRGYQGVLVPVFKSSNSLDCCSSGEGDACNRFQFIVLSSLFVCLLSGKSAALLRVTGCAQREVVSFCVLQI